MSDENHIDVEEKAVPVAGMLAFTLSTSSCVILVEAMGLSMW